jgi:hypothetical protein
MKSSLRYFLAGLIDYAGLFPPAALRLAEAIHNHRRYLGGSHGRLLGRFVVPVGRLGEAPDDIAFPLAVIIPPEISVEDIELLGTFRKHIELLEIRLMNDGDSAGRCTARLQELHRRLAPSGVNNAVLFVEPSAAESAAEAIAAFNRDLSGDRAGSSAGFKLRCGATDTAAAPSPEAVAAAIALCRDHDIPMKFTAGMHLPLTSRGRLTGGGMQHGFLNIFAAALLFWAGRLSAAEMTDCLRDEDPADFIFTDEGFHWRNRIISTPDIQKIRRDRIVSFGSCSFDEPVEGLLALGLLGRSGE